MTMPMEGKKRSAGWSGRGPPRPGRRRLRSPSPASYLWLQTGRCCPEAGAGREHPASPLRFSVVLETRGKSEGSKTHEMEKSRETVSVTMARWVRWEILGHPRKSYQD